jgi:hypothetical protein
MDRIRVRNRLGCFRFALFCLPSEDSGTLPNYHDMDTESILWRPRPRFPAGSTSRPARGSVGIRSRAVLRAIEALGRSGPPVAEGATAEFSPAADMIPRGS